MKILMVSHEFPPIGGGGANACYYLAKEYVEAGNEVTIVTANYESLPECEKVNGVTVVRVNALRQNSTHCSFIEMVSYLLKAVPALKKLMKTQKFDICQVFFGIPSGSLGYWMKKRYGLPYIIRFGGGDIPGFQKRFTIVYKIISPFIKLFWKNAEALIANSEGLQKAALDFYSRKEIKIISNGVDVQYFVPNNKMEQEKEINILFASRLIEGKGLQFVIPYIREIIRNSSKDIRLTVVGDGSYRQKLENMVLENNVEAYVKFEGYKNKKEILSYYQNADIFILPSQREGMPNVVLEAMACGLPIIITPCEGAKELIGNNGIIVPFGDKLGENFSNAIIRIAQNREMLLLMSDESRRRAEEQFDWKDKANQYLTLLEKSVSKI